MELYKDIHKPARGYRKPVIRRTIADDYVIKEMRGKLLRTGRADHHAAVARAVTDDPAIHILSAQAVVHNLIAEWFGTW